MRRTLTPLLNAGRDPLYDTLCLTLACRLCSICHLRISCQIYANMSGMLSGNGKTGPGVHLRICEKCSEICQFEEHLLENQNMQQEVMRNDQSL